MFALLDPFSLTRLAAMSAVSTQAGVFGEANDGE